MTPFIHDIRPDYESWLRCLARRGTPDRVHFAELYLDPEVKDALCTRFELDRNLDRAGPEYLWQREIAIQRFLGYDYVRCGVDAFSMPVKRHSVADTAGLARAGGRSFVDHETGPITTSAEFDAYPWPDPGKLTTAALEWYERNLPDDMCIVGSGGFAHFAEYLTWLMGYQTLCFALFDARDLVGAIATRLQEFYREMTRLLLQFSRLRVLWGSDDMGFRTSTLISPDDLRAFVLPGHVEVAAMSHAAGRSYLLHCCGQIEAIMPDLLDKVKIDGKHSFEDTIIDVIAFKRRYGRRIAILGGIDMDFLCRADEPAIRQRVRQTLDACHSGGGYCLGTGNSVANYVPLDNYLVMLDEGRRHGT
ncbi:MAG: uroporphyrinogen decarboxylase family protein [Tepidisphaeraceae bacterium]